MMRKIYFCLLMCYFYGSCYSMDPERINPLADAVFKAILSSLPQSPTQPIPIRSEGMPKTIRKEPDGTTIIQPIQKEEKSDVSKSLLKETISPDLFVTSELIKAVCNKLPGLDSNYWNYLSQEIADGLNENPSRFYNYSSDNVKLDSELTDLRKKMIKSLNNIAKSPNRYMNSQKQDLIKIFGKIYNEETRKPLPSCQLPYNCPIEEKC